MAPRIRTHAIAVALAAVAAFATVACTDCQEVWGLSGVVDYEGQVFDGGPPMPPDGGYPDEVWLDSSACVAACGADSYEHCALKYTEWPDTDEDTLVFLCYEPVCY